MNQAAVTLTRAMTRWVLEVLRPKENGLTDAADTDLDPVPGMTRQGFEAAERRVETAEPESAAVEPEPEAVAPAEAPIPASPPRAESAAPMPEAPSAPGLGFPMLQRASTTAAQPWLLPREPAGPGIAADEATLGDLGIRAASIIGPGHRANGKPRQDAYRIGQDQAGQHLIVAVADGMSDSRYSDIGANIAVVALVMVLREFLDGGGALESLEAEEIFTAAAGQMYHAATQRDWSADDVRAVAVAAVIPARPDARGARRIWLACLGDASAWTMAAGTWQQVVGDVKKGPASNVVSAYLPHAVDQVVSGVSELAPGCALALMTDGLSDALGLGRAARDWFAERWRRPPSACAFLLDVGYDQAQMLDDRTAVMVWGSEGAES